MPRGIDFFMSWLRSEHIVELNREKYGIISLIYLFYVFLHK